MTTVVLFVAIVGVAGYTYYVADQNHDALCTVRSDFEQRIASSRDFLREHPRGISGITPAVIREGIVNQERTVDALRSLSC